MSRLAAAIAFHYARLFEQAGVTVTYRADSQEISLTAVPARTEAQLSGDNVLIDVEIEDYLVRADELVIDDSQLEPAAGHILEAPNGDIYEVCSPDSVTPAWRWSDAEHTIRRIHLKLIDSA